MPITIAFHPPMSKLLNIHGQGKAWLLFYSKTSLKVPLDMPAAKPSQLERNPKWWIAGLLSFFFGGVGYLYSGHPKRFWLYIACWVAIIFIFDVVGFRIGWSPTVILSLGIILFTYALVVPIDSAIVAYRKTKMRKQWYNKWWIYLLCYIALMAVIELTTRKPFSAVRFFSIPAASMRPTLKVGDYLFSDPYAFSNENPTRGDVVIFKLPKDLKTDYVKRVIGLPGDTVQFKNGTLYLNDKALKTEKIDDIILTDYGRTQKATVEQETLPSGKTYELLNLYKSPQDNTKRFQVPKGFYFVLGDNRDNSSDSRFPELGFVPRANIYAKVKIIWYARNLKRIGTLIK